MPRRSAIQPVERYELGRSPLAQKPTQRQLAELVGLKRDELRALATHHDSWIVRRDEIINGKLRHLAYPRGKLRRVHELLKFHLRKIKQPDYLYSPRKGRSQRDNAARHLGRQQFLTLDLKQFYPSTTRKHIYRWAREELGMFDDVAGLFVRLATVDGIASFGSPLTPVLATLVHRKMFDAIADACGRRGLRISVWVDNFTISGNFVPGELVRDIREIIRMHGLKSHEFCYLTGNRRVAVTGVIVDRQELHASRTVHERIRYSYESLSMVTNDAEAETIINRILSALGTLRYIVGKSGVAGKKAADRMNALRQRRARLVPATIAARVPALSNSAYNNEEPPWS